MVIAFPPRTKLVSTDSKEMDREEAIWVLERLLRLTKSDSERRTLSELV